MSDITRRQSLGLGLGALAAGFVGRGASAAVTGADVAPPKLDLEKGASLRVLRPTKFVDPDEVIFRENTEKFAQATGIPVRVDFVGWEDLRPQAAVAANTGAGPDVVVGWTDDPHLYADKVLDLADIADYLGTKYGGWYPLAERLGKEFGSTKWIGLPFGGTSGPAVYRASWVREAGFDRFPTDHEGFLKLCQGLKRIGHPAGFALGHAVGDANSFCHWLIWSHGASLVDENQKVTINSKETIEALKYGKALYETFIPGTQSWLDPSNNKAFISGEIGLTANGVSLYYAIKNSPDPKVKAMAADVEHARMPVGPAGRPTESTTVLNAMVFKYTRAPNAAKAYLQYMLEGPQYDKWLTGCLGYWSQPLKAYAESEVWTSDPKILVYRDSLQNASGTVTKAP